MRRASGLFFYAFLSAGDPPRRLTNRKGRDQPIVMAVSRLMILLITKLSRSNPQSLQTLDHAIQACLHEGDAMHFLDISSHLLQIKSRGKRDIFT